MDSLAPCYRRRCLSDPPNEGRPMGLMLLTLRDLSSVLKVEANIYKLYKLGM
jgi:hypothetical protein